VVRATLLRATIHVVSAEDFVALRPVVKPILEGAMNAIFGRRGTALDVKPLLAQARAILAKGPRMFEDLREEFLRENPKSDERAMGYAVRMLLPLVQVPVEGAAWAFPAQACFGLAETWLGRKMPAGDAAPDDLVLRYLAGYGPATIVDVHAWSGLARPAVADAVARLRPKLVAFRDEHKRELFDLPKAPRPDPDVPAPVRLVPEYDNLITARAYERFVARGDRPRVFLSALRIAATVLVDGFAAGTWKLTATKKVVTVTVEPFKPLAARVRDQVAAEAEKLARFAEPEVPKAEVKFAKA
jgi:hypothetical protein